MTKKYHNPFSLMGVVIKKQNFYLINNNSIKEIKEGSSMIYDGKFMSIPSLQESFNQFLNEGNYVIKPTSFLPDHSIIMRKTA